MKTTLPNNTILTAAEKSILRKKKVLLKDMQLYPVEDLRHILETSAGRAKEIHALYAFQRVPSIGLQFARDLVSLGYFSFESLKDKNGADIFDELERLTGTRIDPCVEDQCRLVVHYANDRHSTMNWWDFTAERKAYRNTKKNA